MNFKVIVTIGPSILNEEKLRSIDSLGPCFYRINGSHVKRRDDVLRVADTVRSILPKATLMLDLPGNKVRTANLSMPIEFQKGKTFEIHQDNLNFRDFYQYLQVGDKILANDSVYTFEVKYLKNSLIGLLPFSCGKLSNYKGLHVQGIHDDIPFLFETDIELIKAVSEAGIDCLALSFVRNVDDIQLAREMLLKAGGIKTSVIIKIETLAAVNNLESILNETDTILVDRGDLSCDVTMLEMPKYQEKIIDIAQKAKKKIFLATQFLKNMEHYQIPSIAEEVDLYNTIKKGINGIQLSEETAIGQYPVECVKHVFDVYHHCFVHNKEELSRV